MNDFDNDIVTEIEFVSFWNYDLGIYENWLSITLI